MGEKMYFKYLKALLRHKYFVFIEACKLGVPWLGVTHDLSKFRPDEFLPYARYNFTGENTKKAQRAFDLAWLKHQRRNKHHWQWWVLINDSEPQRALEMPRRYRLEMLADWRGAGRAYGNPDTLGWYVGNRNNQIMHEATRLFVDKELGYLDYKDLH